MIAVSCSTLRGKRGKRRKGAVAITLAACLTLLFASGRDARAADALERPLDTGTHDWVGVEKCKTCHKKDLMGNQHAAWLEGPHHRTYQTLLNARSLEIAQQMGLPDAPSANPACLRCHVSAYRVAPMRIANEIPLTDGVGCESCHGPGRDYRKKKIMSDPEKSAAKGLWDTANQGAVCEACHNPDSPTYDPERYQRADGSTAGFDFELAKERIPHPIPAHVKGHYLELEEEQKQREKAAKGAAR